jgi:hypothetical protein
MKITTKLILSLILLAILDMVIPVPFTALLLLYVILEKPPWFSQLVDRVYHKTDH